MERLNVALNRPVTSYVDNVAQLGNIHLAECYGAVNIYEMCNLAGGVSGLAYGLTCKEVYQWIDGAFAALRLSGANQRENRNRPDAYGPGF